MILAEPPRASANSQPHHCRKITNLEGPSRTIVCIGFIWAFPAKKNKISTLGIQLGGTKVPAMRNKNADLASSKNKLEWSFKTEKDGTFARLELRCQEVYFFIFCVVLAGYDMVTETSKATSCICKLRAPSSKNNSKKIDIFHKSGFDTKLITGFRKYKITKTLLLATQNIP